ncbi:MAG: DUF1427 family protein [Rhizomicrobium sp.]
MKAAIGLVLAFAIGFACRRFAIPSPAPTLILGAFLAVAMTCGYRGADAWIARTPGRIDKKRMVEKDRTPS